LGGLLLPLTLAGCTAQFRQQPRSALTSGDSSAADSVGGVGAGSQASPLDDAWRKPAAWPARWGRTRNSLPGRWGVTQIITGPIGAMRQGDESARRMEEQMRNDSSLLIAARRSPWSRSDAIIRGEGPGSFLFESLKPKERVYPGPTAPVIYLKFVSGTRVPDAERGRVAVDMQRTWFAFYDPAPGTAGPEGQDTPPSPPRLAIVLPGMFGTPWGIVDQTVHGLRARGWSVLRLLAHPSRFTERRRFNLVDDQTLPAQAQAIADITGDRAAECAYAVEEAMARIAELRPRVAAAPRMVVGMSGGAMVLPTVVARNPDAYAGAVFIGGGADFLRIAVESNYAEWIDALSFRWNPPVGGGRPDSWARLKALYRERAPLDPLRTATALRGKPVLMLHASADRAVPAELGDELWRRLGEPERWVTNSGHEILFLSVPTVLPKVMDWMERSLPAPPAPPGGSDSARSAPN